MPISSLGSHDSGTDVAWINGLMNIILTEGWEE